MRLELQVPKDRLGSPAQLVPLVPKASRAPLELQARQGLLARKVNKVLLE